MDSKTKAIISHLTIIGWVVSLVLNNDNKAEYTSFYLRQTLGIYIAGALLIMIPHLGWVMGIIVFAFWILSLINCVNNELKVIPFGEHFQEWFKTL